MKGIQQYRYLIFSHNYQNLQYYYQAENTYVKWNLFKSIEVFYIFHKAPIPPTV